MVDQYKTSEDALAALKALAPRLHGNFTPDQLMDQYVVQHGIGSYELRRGPVATAEIQLKRGESVVTLDAKDKAQIAAEAADRTGHNAVPKGTPDEDLLEYCGYSHCPNEACGVQLSAGLGDFEALADTLGSEAEAAKYQTHEFACLTCGAEWGEKMRGRGSSKRAGPAREYTARSDAAIKEQHGGVIAYAHAIYSENPALKRKDAIALAGEKGIAYNTARTQYQKWFQARKTARLK